MDEVSSPPRWPGLYKALNVLFVAVVVVGMLFVCWRGFVAESAQRATPLFGRETELEWEGEPRRFLLVSYADLSGLKPGDMVVQDREVPARVWRVAACETESLLLERVVRNTTRQKRVPLPQPEGAAKYVLLRPVP